MGYRDDDHEDDTYADRRAQGVVEQLQRQVTGVDKSVVRLEGKIETIAVRIESNVEQRERMEVTLQDIAHQMRVANGRTRKNEDAISELQHGQAEVLRELARTLSLQPDGTVSITLPQRAPLNKKQKVGIAALIVPILIEGIDLIRQGIELAIEWLRHGAGK